MGEVYAARGPATGALAALRFSGLRLPSSTAHGQGATPLAGREARPSRGVYLYVLQV